MSAEIWRAFSIIRVGAINLFPIINVVAGSLFLIHPKSFRECLIQQLKTISKTLIRAGNPDITIRLSVAFEICFEEVLQMTTDSSEVKETLQRAQLITYMCVHAQLLNRVWFFATSWTVAHQVPLSEEFPRQECWSGRSSPTPEDLPDPGITYTISLNTTDCHQWYGIGCSPWILLLG